MIIDKVQLAGSNAYFQDPRNPGTINLAANPNVTSRTEPLRKGKQLEISGIELLIESEKVDLTDLFGFQSTPLFSITVMKEMFPTLFAEPFGHRVHNISGFEDFKRGTLENGKVMDIDGIPTIISTGTGICKWISPLYPMPEPIPLDHASWELAASRKTSASNFRYRLELHKCDANRNRLQTVYLTNPADPTEPVDPDRPNSLDLNPTQPRKVEKFDLHDVGFYEVEFTADVRRDAAIYEKHTALIGESIGTPLLRAVNLLEPVRSIYNVYSLQELLSLSSEYHLFEFYGQPLNKMLVTLDLSATLVHSDYEKYKDAGDPSDPNTYNDPTSFYEFVEIKVITDQFSNLEAKLVGEVLMKPAVK
jgi:hypothetical protein